LPCSGCYSIFFKNLSITDSTSDDQSDTADVSRDDNITAIITVGAAEAKWLPVQIDKYQLIANIEITA
jgi:hypothetical protein